MQMSDTGTASSVKHSYTIPCKSDFRDAIERLAAARKVNVGDIARSVLLVVPEEVIATFPDPGEPDGDDRETVILKSGPAQGRPWRRKPRLQVRMAPGYRVEIIRQALGVALSMGRGDVRVRLDDPTAQPEPVRPEPVKPEPIKPAVPPPGDNDNGAATALAEINEELERLRVIINVLSFEPLADGVRNREEALHVLGFPPNARPDKRTVRAKFRMLATIHHPDSHHGSHNRMSQLNAAMDLLRDCA